jgi:Tol biopolymer transport system component
MPSWSPDGQRIAITKGERYDTTNIYTVSADGDDLKQLTNDVGLHTPASWSPDSQQLVFSRSTGEGLRMFRVDADGSGLQQLLDVGAWLPVWSPDGQWIAYQSVSQAGGTFTSLTNSDGSVVLDIELTQGPVVWSPTSEQLVAGRYPGGRMVLVNVDGTILEDITQLLGNDAYGVESGEDWYPASWRG